MRKEKPALRIVPYSRNYSHEQYLFGSMDRALQRDRSRARKQLTSGGTCRPRFSILATSEQWFPNGRQQLRTPPPHLACISHHPTAEARDKTAMTSLRLLAVLDVLSSTPARAKRLAPRPDGPLTHFTSPRGEKCRLAARGESHAGGVTRLGAEGVTPGRSRNAAPHSPRRRPEAARNPLGDGRFFVPTAAMRARFFLRTRSQGADLAAHRDCAFSSQRPPKVVGFVVRFFFAATTEARRAFRGTFTRAV